MATTGVTPDQRPGPDAADAGAAVRTASPVARLKEHLRDPMSRSGYSLVLGSAITSALGMGFWVLAARLYDAKDVGTASALLSAMGFLGSASTIGLKNGFVRFLPSAGTAGPRFIRNAYAVCIVVSAVAALVFVAGQPVWAGELSMIREGPVQIGFFVVATASWTIFVLQDSVLTGLRLASWVPAENAIFAVAKLGLLFALVAVPRWGIYLAWSIPAIALLLPVNLLIRRRVLARPVDPRSSNEISLPDVMRFAAGDHAAAFLWLGTTELLSLVVLAQAGPESSAFYFLSFTIAYSLYLITSNVSSAFVVEAALDPDQEEALVRKAVLQSARLVVPAALLAVIAAPLLLGIIGSEYEANGVPLLRLLLLSAIPQILVGIAIGRARLHRHVRIVVLVYAVTAMALFAGATLGLRRGGLEAVGWTWLVTQLVMASALTPTVLHPALGRRLLGTLLRWASAVKSQLHQLGRTFSARRVVPAVLADAGAEEPHRYSLLPSQHDAIVARASIGDEPVVVRVAMSEAGAAALADNAEMLQRIHSHERLPRWRAGVPDVARTGEVEGRTYVAESFLPGGSVDDLSGEVRATALDRARTAIGALHRATSRPARFDDSVAHRWIDEPLTAIERLPGMGGRVSELQRLRAWLRQELVGRQVKLCWVHGDYWAGNVLATVSDGVPRVTGIIDWENGRTDGLAELDLAHLWLTEQPGEIGAALLDAIDSPELWPAARSSDGELVVGGAALPARAVLVLAWLGHVAAGAGRSTDHPPSRVWITRNVTAVLDRADALATAPAPAPEPVEAPEAWGNRARSAAAAVVVAPEHAPDELTDEVGSRAVATPARRLIGRADLASVSGVLFAIAAWCYGIWGADPRNMTGIGLISLFTAPMVAALAILVLGFVLAVRRDAPGWVFALHVVALIALIHGTPAILYETLRYSWAWKHTGIVEYITRTGSVDTTVAVTPIYHSWPGFFAGSALLTELVGARASARIAMWAPVAFNLLNLFAVRFLFRSLTRSTRVMWVATWIFFISNWVGQDYFSPQAMAYFLYLMVIGVALRGFRRDPDQAVFADPIPRRQALVVLVLLLGVIASSHQITPFLAMVVLAGLVLFRQVRGWYLPVIAGVLMGGWAFTVGNGELLDNTQSLIDSFGRPISNAGETLEKSVGVAPEQQVVSQAGRLVVVALAGLAFVGLVRLWRRKGLSPAVLVIAATPAALPFATEFGGEAIFRVFLFAVPAMALLAAAAIEPAPKPSPRAGGPARSGSWSLPRSLVAVGVSVCLLTGYVVAYYGKDQQYYFTQAEIDASDWVASHAHKGSLLVEGSRNYPSQFRNYEYFTYVAISREPTESWERVLADPVGRLSGWLDNDEYTDTFILITRSQKIDVDLSGPLPKGSLERIERLLRGSDRFHIPYQNEDAVVFQLTKDVTAP